MARKPTKNQIVKITSKVDFLSFLKFLTKWVCNENRKIADLDEYRKIFDLDDRFLLMRILSYCYSNPQIIWYFNKYLNNLFEISNIKFDNFLNSLMIILDMNFHNKNQNLFYMKSSEEKDRSKYQIKILLKEYFFKIHKKIINDTELNFYYKLIKNNHIKISEIISIDEMLNGKATLKEEDIVLIQNIKEKIINISEKDIKKYINESRIRELPPKITDLCNKLKIVKTKREKCKKCKLFNRQMIILDTNLQEPGEVDFLFIALNPGKEECIYDKPLVGKSGEYHREKMFYLPSDITWCITNIILCSTNNQKEIGTDKEIQEVVYNCYDILAEIINRFPAKYYIPMGKQAAELYGIKGSIVSNCGKIYNINGSKIIPLIHPSAVIQYHGQNEVAYNFGMNEIIKKASELKGTTPILTENTINVYKTETITKVDKTYTLFDIVENGNTILMIYIDKNGKKHYQHIENKIPIYISNKEWDKCDMLTNDVNYISYVSGFDKKEIMEKANDSFHILKNSLFE